MKIAFYGGQTAGTLTLLTLVAIKHHISCVFPEDEGVASLAKNLNLMVKNKSLLNTPECIRELKNNCDLFICCHGRKILSEELVKNVKCINLHPCLYRYKGAHPIKRLIEDKNKKASVAVHYMTPLVDQGETIVEIFREISDVEQKNEAEVYNELYSTYIEALIKAIKKI